MTDFQQPLGMKLREDNRWVKKAQIIPWSKIEVRYAALFPSKTGNVAKPLRQDMIEAFRIREGRFVFVSEKNSDDHIILDIGDISDISLVFPSEQVLTGVVTRKSEE